MDSNFDKITFLAKHSVDEVSEFHGAEGKMHQVKELQKTIDVQREIIAEQAIKIQELQYRLKKFGWNM
jgi:hypothetical protein